MNQTKGIPMDRGISKMLGVLNYSKENLYYDEETGTLRFKTSLGSRRAFDKAGHLTKDGYIRLNIHGKCYLAHRVIYLLKTGAWPDGHIDHINRSKWDNRWSNLRVVTNTINSRNCNLSKVNKSGVQGVSFYSRTGKWQATINENGKVKHLGYFNTIEEAREARKPKELELGYLL